MKLITTITLVFFALFMCQAQGGEIDVKNSFWTGTKFYQGSNKLDKSLVKEMLSENGEALNLFNKGMSQQSTASIIAGIGGALIGWPIGSAIGGGDPQWILAGIGVGVVVIGVPIYSSGGKKVNSAIDLYSGKSIGSILPKGTHFSASVIGSSEGLGLQISF